TNVRTFPVIRSTVTSTPYGFESGKSSGKRLFRSPVHLYIWSPTSLTARARLAHDEPDLARVVAAVTGVRAIAESTDPLGPEDVRRLARILRREERLEERRPHGGAVHVLRDPPRTREPRVAVT